MEAINLIKIGGSVITNKDRECSFKRTTAVRIARNLPPRTVIVHGSGSFGKPPAIRHGYLDGVIPQDRIRSILYVRLRLSALNALFTEILQKNGVAAFGISASLLFMDTRRRLEYRGNAFIQKCLERDVVPVIYSDFIVYRADSLRVISSDEIMLALAKKYKPCHTVFATDVDGVFRRQSGDCRGRPEIIGYLSKSDKGNIVQDVNASSNDVTGGMREKIRFALGAAEHSRRCIILNGSKGDRISSFCAGADVIGTRILAPRMSEPADANRMREAGLR